MRCTKSCAMFPKIALTKCSGYDRRFGFDVDNAMNLCDDKGVGETDGVAVWRPMLLMS